MSRKTNKNERQATDPIIQLKSSAAGAAILYRRLGLSDFLKVTASLLKEQLRGEPWKILPPPADEKEMITRAEIRDAVILYRILKKLKGKETALQITGEIVTKGAILLFDYLLDPINLENLATLASEEQYNFIARNLNRFPNAVTTIEAVSPDKVQFTVTRCHMAEICRKIGLEELSPIFCSADKEYFEETVGVNFRRDNTIAENAKACDFLLYR